MTNRKQIELDRFKEEIDREWKLSIVEQEVLDSFLNLFLAEKNTEIKKVEHLLNDETEELLELLNDKEIMNYAEFNLGMIEEDDVEECKDLEDYSDRELSDEFFNRELGKFTHGRFDITSQSQLEEMTELFLEADLNKRQEIINSFKL